MTAVTGAAEYKQVTVLFADVVHSMDLAAAVGAERLREIMAGLFDRCAAVVRRYGGTVDKFTGDGIMAVFGAPMSLEDHALRACLAALDVQRQIQCEPGAEGLQLRVGLNSGEVVAGEIGSGPGSYTAIGAQVGMAQRMESVAPPGGVMLSGSTARLVEDRVVLAEPELVCIKGVAEPVAARRLVRVEPHCDVLGPVESTLVGRRWEMTAVEALLEQAIAGHGGVVGVVGPPGIGKSRLIREIAAAAKERGVPVYSGFCEAHAADIPFHVVAALLRAATGVADLDPSAARRKIRAGVAGADEQDLQLLDDLLGIADPDVEVLRIDPDARRRRLIALVNGDALARTSAGVYVIEDAHWIDEVSEAMLADFITVIPQTPLLVAITYRPEYHGRLTRTSRGQTISLAPLSGSDVLTLIDRLLGVDPSVGELAGVIAERAGGNPFFVQEMVRDLAERGVVRGDRGAYVLSGAPGEVSVPSTLQATIGARIDRLEPAAKETLTTASVIGSRFSAGLLADLDIDPVLDQLVEAELIDQVKFTPNAEYAFHHPLIRTVAYESQLKSDRVALHRRLAAVVEAHDVAAADANAALIAEHLEAAGDLRAAYAWHMRAGTWSTNRNIAAAQISWERAAQIADALPAEDPDRLAMRIAPRTLSCGSGFRGRITVAGPRFDELQELCSAAADKSALAVAMTGLIGEHIFHGRIRAAVTIGIEQAALIQSIGNPELTVGLAVGAIGLGIETGEMAEVLLWSQAVIDLTAGEPTIGNFIVGSPLALAFAARGLARCALGGTGWRADFSQGTTLARSADPMSRSLCIAWAYGAAIAAGVRLPDDVALRDIDDALRVAQRSADDVTVGFALFTQVTALLHVEPPDDERVCELLRQLRDMCTHGRFYASEIPAIDLWTASVLARRGDRDGAVLLGRDALGSLFDTGQFTYSVVGTRILGEMLVDRGRGEDLVEARAIIDRLAAAPLSVDYVLRDLVLLRLRALLARAQCDEDGYRESAARYRKMATSLGFEGHMALAGAM